MFYSRRLLHNPGFCKENERRGPFYYKRLKGACLRIAREMREMRAAHFVNIL